jgi:hypothetical protein
MEPEPLPEGWGGQAEDSTTSPAVPEEGYFEYEESWFDDSD